MKETGLIHIYCGDGKGKTTAAVGLAVRHAGAGGKVVLAQFLKDGTSSECRALAKLENEGYLHSEDYGRRLLSLFARCWETLPIGYAAFHLPWVAEWYTAARQYRAAYELLRDFPVKVPLPL